MNEMSEIYNYTPHTVNIFTETDLGDLVKVREFFPSTKTFPRVIEEINPFPPINGFEVVRKTYSRVEGLPDPRPNVWLIVSVLVLMATDRHDVVCPDTGPESVIRDSEGKILGVRRFQIR